MTSVKQAAPINNSPSPSSFSPPYFHSAYSPKIRHSIYFDGPGRTKQQFSAECDINTIMARYQLTGLLSHTNQRVPSFGEVPDYDFQGAMAIVLEAEQMFADLPSAIRDRFSNNPASYLDFIQDPRNKEEALKLGLLKPMERAVGDATLGAIPPSTQNQASPEAPKPV